MRTHRDFLDTSTPSTEQVAAIIDRAHRLRSAAMLGLLRRAMRAVTGPYGARPRRAAHAH